MDWNKAKNIVAGVDGLEVTYEQGDGTLGAVRLGYRTQQSAFPTQLPHGGATTPTPSPGQALNTYRIMACGRTTTGPDAYKPSCTEFGFAGGTISTHAAATAKFWAAAKADFTGAGVGLFPNHEHWWELHMKQPGGSWATILASQVKKG